MSINERIKVLREKLDISQSEFAKKIGITQPSLSDIEKGKTKNIDERTIKLICVEFNVNEEWLRNGIGEMFDTENELLTLFTARLKTFDELDKKIILEYIKLNKSQREVIKNYIKSIFS